MKTKNRLITTEFFSAADDNIDKEKVFWKKVSWSDETEFLDVFGNNVQRYVRKGNEEAFSLDNTVPTVHRGGGSIMLRAVGME